jgi:pantoate--beta-alanine ligase
MVKVIETVQQMQSLSDTLRSEHKRIALVPTMGALHEGHLSLIDLAREHADVVILSIYVNPVQFGPNEDFDKYPRPKLEDLKLCNERGVDFVFLPQSKEFYPPGYSVYVVEKKHSQQLCGISRPFLFEGVCTVVNKLFNIVQPHVAVFGQKDFQQVAVIKKMVKNLHMRIEIVMGLTIRDADGLALSSRNAYLSSIERQHACAIYKALQVAEKMVKKGNYNIDRIIAEITYLLSLPRSLRIIYVSIIDSETLEVLRQIVPGKSIIAVAVWCNEVRLIDNILV